MVHHQLSNEVYWFKYEFAGGQLRGSHRDSRLSDYTKNLMYLMRAKDPKRYARSLGSQGQGLQGQGCRGSGAYPSCTFTLVSWSKLHLQHRPKTMVCMHAFLEPPAVGAGKQGVRPHARTATDCQPTRTCQRPPVEAPFPPS